MKQYSDLIQRILTTGQTREDRTGTGTIGIFGHQMEFDLSDGFPLLTLKKLHIPSIVHELIWLISGNTNIQYLKENKIRIWDEWADADGELGPVYGAQWRTHCSVTDEPIDQLANLIRDLKSNPFSRRHIITAWNPAEIHLMALPPCHMMMQFYVDKDYKLSCHLYQRSADVFLGVPFNIASYALLTSMIAQVVGYKVGKFVHSFGDAHIYLNHVDQCRIMLNREALPLPRLTLDPSVKDIDDFKFEHVQISNYHPHEALNGQVAV